MRWGLVGLCAWIALGCATPSWLASDRSFDFAVLGDVPYSPTEEAQLERVIAALERERLAFVAHVGDLKPGRTPCSDALYAQRRALLDSIDHAVVFTPGDNDWTDCHHSGSQPRERLDQVRAAFFDDPAHSLGGHPLSLTSQASSKDFPEFVENARWRVNGVVFATLHLVGMLGDRARSEGTYVEAPALAWLSETFTRARDIGSRTVVLITHANPGFERLWQGTEPEMDSEWGFAAFVSRLEREVAAFDGEVMLIHGDTHYFRVDKPLARRLGVRLVSLSTFTRLEAFGSPNVHWIHVRVDPGARSPFRVSARRR